MPSYNKTSITAKLGLNYIRSVVEERFWHRRTDFQSVFGYI